MTGGVERRVEGAFEGAVVRGGVDVLGRRSRLDVLKTRAVGESLKS